MKTAYNKLVRDRIPEVIQASGKMAEFEALDDDPFALPYWRNWLRRREKFKTLDLKS